MADYDFFNIQKDILFDWHYYDPADSYEISRTWEIAPYQEDIPNPFIIDPTLMWRIYFHDSHPMADINSDQTIDVLDIVLSCESSNLPVTGSKYRDRFSFLIS